MPFGLLSVATTIASLQLLYCYYCYSALLHHSSPVGNLIASQPDRSAPTNERDIADVKILNKQQRTFTFTWKLGFNWHTTIMIYFATWPEWGERQGKRKWKCILGCKKTFIQVSICEGVSCFRIKFNCICGGMGGCVHILEGEVSVQIKGRRHIPRAPPDPGHSAQCAWLLQKAE